VDRAHLETDPGVRAPSPAIDRAPARGAATRSTAFLREPLVHFLVLGALLFALAARGDDRDTDAGEIVVTAGQVEHLATVFAATWKRPPSAAELEELVQEHVREELACREALALGLERDDAIVRRRLRQKLEFVVNDLVARQEPDDAALAAFLRERPAAFAREAHTSFRHVYLSRERRGDALADDARALLAELRAGAAAPAEAGDPQLLPDELELASAGEIDALLGPGFAAALAALPTGEWSGPVESSYGLHLVHVFAREPGRMPELDEVRAEVEREWLAARRAEELARFYRGLAERYRIVIEPPPAAEAPQ
jgi:parvulin-like peptidyl-prolyl isomerase